MGSMSSLGPAPGLAPPAAGVPAWCVTLFLSFLLYPRKCPIAGHLHGVVSFFLALPLIFRCVLAESPSLAGLSRAHSICPCVPLSSSPGSLPASMPALPSWLCPAHWACCPAALPAVSLAVHSTLLLQPACPAPAPQGACPGKRSLPSAWSRVSAGVRCREGRCRGAGAGLDPSGGHRSETGHRWVGAGEGKGGKKRGIERKWGNTEKG